MGLMDVIEYVIGRDYAQERSNEELDRAIRASLNTTKIDRESKTQAEYNRRIKKAYKDGSIYDISWRNGRY